MHIKHIYFLHLDTPFEIFEDPLFNFFIRRPTPFLGSKFSGMPQKLLQGALKNRSLRGGDSLFMCKRAFIALKMVSLLIFQMSFFVIFEVPFF